MIKFLLLMTVVFQVHAASKDSCYKFKAFGKVKISPDKFEFVINQDSQSEKTFLFKKIAELRLAPYTKGEVMAEFIFKSKDPQTGDLIEDFKDMDFHIPDPLNSRGLKIKDKTKCPAQ